MNELCQFRTKVWLCETLDANMGSSNPGGQPYPIQFVSKRVTLQSWNISAMGRSLYKARACWAYSKKGMRYFIERRRRRRRQSSSSSFRLTSKNRMEEANSLGLSRGDGVECYMTYLKRRDQVKMMGLGQRAMVLLLHSHVGNISTRTFPLDSRAFTDSTGKRIWEKKTRSWWSLRG